MIDEVRDRLLAAYGPQRFTMTVRELELRAGVRRRSVRVAWATTGALATIAAVATISYASARPLPVAAPNPGTPAGPVTSIPCDGFPSIAAAPPQAPAETSTVTLGIYSGRPDPAWTLSGLEAGCLEAAMAKLPTSSSQVPDRGLGYHGFTIDTGGNSRLAWAGTVSTIGQASSGVRSDPTCSVERFLLATAKPHLTSAEYETVQEALRRC